MLRNVDYISTKEAETTTNDLGKMSESTSVIDLEELNQLRSELINSKNTIDELKNEVKMKVLLNDNFHKENEQLMIKLNNSLSEITSLKASLQNKDDSVEQ